MLTLSEFQANPTTSLTDSPALTLRLWYNTEFLDVNGNVVMSGPRDFYITFDCSITDNVITVAATDIYTTLDAEVQFPQAINCSAQFFSGNTGKDFLFTQWVIPSEAAYPGGEITFEQLYIYNNGANTLANPPATYLTEAQTIAYFSTISPAPDASTTTKGIGKLSIAAASSTNPIFLGVNDYATTLRTGAIAISAAPASASFPIAVGKTDYAATDNLGVVKLSAAPVSGTNPIAVAKTDLASITNAGIVTTRVKTVPSVVAPTMPPSVPALLY